MFRGNERRRIPPMSIGLVYAASFTNERLDGDNYQSDSLGITLMTGKFTFS